MRFIDFFDKGAAGDPDKACFVEGERRVSYAEAQAASHAVAAALREREVGPDTKVGVLTYNSIEGYLAVLGTLRCGAVWVALNARNSVDDTAYHLSLSDSEVLFFSAEMRAQAEALRERVPSLRLLVCLDEHRPGEDGLPGWIEAYRGAQVEDAPHGPLTVARMSMTGGTTGKPKAVLIPHLSNETVCVSLLALLDIRPDDIYVCVAPFTHAAGTTSFPFLARGATIVVVPKAEPASLLALVEKEQATALFVPPTVIYAMLNDPSIRTRDFSSLRYLMYGASPMSGQKLAEAMEVFGPVLVQFYAQSEAPMAISAMLPEDHAEAMRSPEGRRRLTSAGRVCPYTRVRIVDDAGKEVAAGESGEICVKGNIAMVGFYNDDEATRATLRDGWVHTGDIGRFDEAGFLYLVDRKRDMIISGGFNVYPSEVEQVLLSHPSVFECAVVGAPHEKWGEQVTAVVELYPGRAPCADELVAMCRERLGGIKTPKQVLFWEQMPRNALGKVLRRKVRDHFWAGTDRSI